MEGVCDTFNQMAKEIGTHSTLPLPCLSRAELETWKGPRHELIRCRTRPGKSGVKCLGFHVRQSKAGVVHVFVLLSHDSHTSNM